MQQFAYAFDCIKTVVVYLKKKERKRKGEKRRGKKGKSKTKNEEQKKENTGCMLLKN